MEVCYPTKTCVLTWILQSEYYGKQVIVADREMVESESDTILANAENINVAFLVVGDPYGYAAMLKYKLTGMKQTCI